MTEWFDLDADEERAVAAFMDRVAHLRTPKPGLPSEHAPQLWVKGRLLEQWEGARRVQRPLEIMQRVEIAGGLLAASVLLYLSFVG